MTPAPPIGLSYVASAAEASGHEVAVVDLLVAGDGEGALRRALRTHRPEVVGISVRNIDSCSKQRPAWQMGDVTRHIENVRESGERALARPRARRDRVYCSYPGIEGAKLRCLCLAKTPSVSRNDEAEGARRRAGTLIVSGVGSELRRPRTRTCCDRERGHTIAACGDPRFNGRAGFRRLRANRSDGEGHRSADAR